MTINNLLDQIKQSPSTIEFSEVIATIDENYDFIPTAFQNGETFNEAGKNSGSCKFFSFAQMECLNAEQTLACFGAFYRKDVLEKVGGTDHQNIRNFIKFGWDGIKFDAKALSLK
jgi:HopJ type III effector protein